MKVRISVSIVLFLIFSGTVPLFANTNFISQIGQGALVESTYSQINTEDGNPEFQAVRKQFKSLIDSSNGHYKVNPNKSIVFVKEAISIADKYILLDLKIEALLKLGWIYNDKECQDSSALYFKQAIEISESIQDTLSLCKSYSGIANHYTQTGQLILATSYLKKIYNYRNSIHDEVFLGNVMYALGHRNKNLGNYNESLKYFMDCLKYRESAASDSDIASALISIGNIYRHMDDYENAFLFTAQAKELYLKAGSKLTRVYNQYGLIHLAKDEYEKALEYFQLAYDQNEKDDDKVGMGRESNNIGITLRSLGRLEESLDYQFKSLAFKKEAKDLLYIGSSYNNIGNAYLDLKVYGKAKKYIDSAYNYNYKLQLKDRLMSNYEGYYRLFNALGNHKKALEYYILYSQIKDTIYSSEEQRKITELSTLYELEKKESENLVLLKDNQIQELKFEKQKELLYLFIVISGFVILLIIFVYYRYRVKSKTNIKLKESNELITRQRELLKETNATKDKFFSIIAHDLRSPFNTILGFAEILQNDYNDISDEERKSIIRLMVKNSKNTLVLVENLLIWARSQKDAIQLQMEYCPLYLLIEESISIYYGTAAIKGIRIRNNVDKDIVIYADAPTIKTVIMNLINNAIKFCNTKDSIEIFAKQFEETTELWIKDTGIGMNSNTVNILFKIEESFSTLGTKNEKGTGLGLIICKEFVEKNGGKIRAESEVGAGSTFIISLRNKPLD